MARTPELIVVSALTMVLTGCIDRGDIYDAVQWDVIVLLAGVIPLGIAMETSGAATLVANALVDAADVLPEIVLLGLFYVLTATLTNIISNNASVVLMIPVAAEAAVTLDLWAFPFIRGTATFRRRWSTRRGSRPQRRPAATLRRPPAS